MVAGLRGKCLTTTKFGGDSNGVLLLLVVPVVWVCLGVFVVVRVVRKWLGKWPGIGVFAWKMRRPAWKN